MKVIKIAILGATSHIAKGLICCFNEDRENQLYLFARSPQKVKDFLKFNSVKKVVFLSKYDGFLQKKYDVIINCVGIGSPRKLQEEIASIFQITETYDNMALDYLRISPHACYINFSSGAVYGGSFSEPVKEDSACRLPVNSMGAQDYYGIAKINAEAKHRAQRDLHIIDIRIFSYFSRFIDLDAGYFLTDLIKSVKRKSKFITNPCDFIRDYLDLRDLFCLIKLVMKGKPSNAVFDAYSHAPVNKFTLLDYFSKTYGLKYKINEKISFVCPTGEKNIYCSGSKYAASLGYKPKFSSMETVAAESEYILGAASE